MSFLICCILSGVNISSTSVRKTFPLNTSTTLLVTSVNVHLEGVFVGGGGTMGGALPNKLVLFLMDFFGLVIDMDLDIGDRGPFLNTPRATEKDRLWDMEFSSSYHPDVAAFASASAVPTALKASSVSRINCSTLSDISPISCSSVYLKLCVGVLLLTRGSIASASRRSKVAPSATVVDEADFEPSFDTFNLGDRGIDSENMSRHVFASPKVLVGVNGGR
jgi:hypothetical protein